ncbi:macrolide phosphotransferase [Arthrobacter globiformis]|uniref:phosphotransferase n=1 Tax=Arthrobacter globiformis TaxID=1665 RepID=UPI002789AB73|nr:phosphotransferase [Arthrobacter globiformis]MDQ1059436.1 macrolide phosphotransferase [Arthrobacter globiformis]
MRREPIELAAVATAAVPGLSPTAVSSAPDDPADFDSALLLDAEGKRWRVRSPRHAEASTRLETEFLVLRAFAPAIRAELPFLMPTVAGTVRQQDLTTFVYSHLHGATRTVEELTAGPPQLAKEIGTALAAIHDLPRALVSNADLPSYTPNEFRQRRLNELDQAATTGKIPALLLRRWEHAMEDVSLWRFNPCVVHGDLHEDNLLVEDHRVTAVTGWTDLRIGDPADDLAWLVASNEHEFVDAVVKHYTAKRRDAPDNHLLRRAALSAEFALAQYLVKGIAAADADMIAEAEGMLSTLADDIAEYGGQPISVEPLPPAQPDSPPTGQAPASPGLVDAPAATDISEAMPAVHVTPIPVDVKPLPVEVAPIPVEVAPVPADEEDPWKNADQPSGQDTSQGAVEDDAAEDAGASDDAEADRVQDGTPEDAQAAKPSGADTSTVALTVVDAKTT